MGAFSFRSDKMRFSIALFVLVVVVIASCAAQPQGNARAAALDAGNVPSDRHYRSSRYRSSRSYGRYGFGGCSGSSSNNNSGDLSSLLANLNNVVSLLNNLIGANGLLNGLTGGAPGAFCIVGLQCATGTCTNSARA